MVLMLGWQQWAGPAFAESAKFAAQAARDREATQELAAQLAALEQQVNSPNAEVQVRLAQLRSSFVEQEPQIQAVQQSLVTARNMPVFLESLLAGNKSLQLLSLETLAPEAVDSAASDEAAAKMKAKEAGLKLYKHGVRLRLSGGYRELTAYLSDLEQASQRVLWGDLRLNVSAHPKLELTLTVYTLSLDKAWMTL